MQKKGPTRVIFENSVSKGLFEFIARHRAMLTNLTGALTRPNIHM